MSQNQHSRKSFILILTVSMLVVLIVFGTQYALANKVLVPIDQMENKISPTGMDDDHFDVGMEWINNYPNSTDVTLNDESCDGFYNAVYIQDAPHNFFHSGLDAWARDFKNQVHYGNENYWVDNVDMAMVCATGNGGHVNFSNAQYGLTLYSTDAYNAYGDKDLEWLAFDTSDVFDDIVLFSWIDTMEGIHLLLGFKNTMYLNTIGDGTTWANYMNGSVCYLPRTITQAWFKTVDDLQPVNTCARVIAENEESYSDFLWGKGDVSSDYPIGYPRFNWDHCATETTAPKFLDSNNQPEVLSMPIVQVIDRTVNEDYVMNNIAPAFGFDNLIPCLADELYSIMKFTGGMTLTLQVDAETGSYSFQNLGKLWTTPVITPTLPSELEAAEIINTWFSTTPAEGLPAMQYRNPDVYEYSTENIIEFLPASEGNNSDQIQVVSQTPVDVSMTYPRSLTVVAGTTNGLQNVDFPMVGAGARMKIYLGDGGEIIGVQGGSRDVQVMSDQVPILDASKVWASFLSNPSLALPEVSFVADTITYTIATLAYYEMPYTQHQNDLIPVWDFNANFYTKGILTDENVQIYMPAALAYLPPQVAILNPEDGATFWAGEPISFEGWINQGTPPYTIQWTSSSDGFLGNTLNIIAALGSEIRSNTVFNPTVSLTVTDANGLTATHTITLAIKPIFWLPVITK